VDRKDLELPVVGIVRVGEEDEVIAGPPALLDDLADSRDGGVLACRIR
jgi:hypothetical protein